MTELEDEYGHALLGLPVADRRGYLDLTEQTNLPTAQQIQAAASRIGMAKWMIDFRACAVVVNRDALFGMLRMFEVFAHPHFERLRVFRDATAARAWLDNGSSPSQAA